MNFIRYNESCPWHILYANDVHFSLNQGAPGDHEILFDYSFKGIHGKEYNIDAKLKCPMLERVSGIVTNLFYYLHVSESVLSLSLCPTHSAIEET